MILFLAQPEIKHLASLFYLGNCTFLKWFCLLLFLGRYTQMSYGGTPRRMKLSGRKGGFDLDQVPTLQSKEVIEVLIFALKFVPMKHVHLNITSYVHRSVGFFYALRELQKSGDEVDMLTGLLSFLVGNHSVIRLEIAILPDQAQTY